VIADDSVLMREGITRILAEGEIEVAAGVGDAPSLLEAVENCKPELAIIDVRMPPTYIDEGLRAAIEIRHRWPAVALVVLSQFVEERYASELLADNTDKIGYLLKDRISDVGEFIEALQRVANGGTALDRRSCASSSPAAAKPTRSSGSPHGRQKCSRSWPRADRTRP
jgi:DNA-binding NarL/FixJ family response regulator